MCSERFPRGIYSVAEGVGHHDLVITRGHDADFPDLSPNAAREVLESFRERYLMLLHDKCLAYISFFHNWGPTAGASIYHPHYQIVAIPVIPPDVKHSYYGSRQYYNKHHTCVHCAIIAFERKEGKRIIFENESAIVFAPFASRSSFEFRVFPKRHTAFFETSKDAELADVAMALQFSLRRMKRVLKDPDYNFFLHTAPLKKKDVHENYHWHIEVLPKTNIFAGFELGTGIEINPTDPDEAAKMLRKN
jgi:UDPglucose--hexose-1-phosphate uridylyltransferase